MRSSTRKQGWSNMILDRLLTFTGNIATGSIVDSPTATGDATNIIDLGVNYPSPPQTLLATDPGGPLSRGGARDIGVGDDPMLKLLVVVTTTFAGLTSLTCTLQGAPESTTTANTPGTFTPMWTSPAAVVLANLVQGAYLANVDVPRQIPGQPMPRFLKLTFTVAGAGTGGSVYAGIVIDRFDQPWGGTATVPAPSGYVPGITINN